MPASELETNLLLALGEANDALIQMGRRQTNILDALNDGDLDAAKRSADNDPIRVESLKHEVSPRSTSRLTSHERAAAKALVTANGHLIDVGKRLTQIRKAIHQERIETAKTLASAPVLRPVSLHTASYERRGESGPATSRPMRKFANTTELQAELEKVLAYAQSERPSRVRLASELQSLSARVARAAPTADEAEAWWKAMRTGEQIATARSLHLSSPASNRWHAADWEKVMDHYARVVLHDDRGYTPSRNF